MKQYFLSCAAILATITVLCSGSCRKAKVSELEKLPPATQTGAKTFGCLLNGKAFTPYINCSFLCPPAIRFFYDQTNGGQFGVQADNDNFKQSVVFGIDSCSAAKRYPYRNIPSQPVRFAVSSSSGSCSLYSGIDPQVNVTGEVNITRFDIANGIISGTFDFTLSKPGCETMTITNGRFDAKF